MKNMMRYLALVVGLFAAGILCCAGSARAADTKITVDTGAVVSHVTPYMTGIVLEDCNHEIYGGLNSQMIFGESFQEPANSHIKGFKANCGIWTVKDGVLHGTSRIPAKLISDLPPFDDGELGVEIRASGKNSIVGGLLFRANEAGPGLQNLKGYEALIHQGCATIQLSRYDHISMFRHHIRPMPSPDKWIALVIKIHGNTIEVVADGKTMDTYVDKGSRVAPGSIGLSLLANGTAEFRNFWVKTGDQVTKIPFEVSTAEPQDDVSSQWAPIRSGAAKGVMKMETKNPLFGHQSQIITFAEGQGEIGIENRGLNQWGLGFKEGKPYEGCLRVKVDKPTELVVALESGDGSKVLAERTLQVPAGADWQKVDFKFTPNASEAAGRFAVKMKKPGSVVVGYALLQPGEWGRYKGLPVRGDIAEKLCNGTFPVIRYGGAMVHGGYRWKPMIGPREQRPPYGSGYYMYPSHGWGIIDFLNLCEASGQLAIPDFDINETGQDMADFVEYANGPVDSEWGKKRVADGHPKPYNIKHIELGNESGINEKFWLKFKDQAESIWGKDPSIILVVGDYEYPEEIKDPYNFKSPHITTLAAHKKMLELAKKYNAEVWFDVHVGTGDPMFRNGLRGLPSFIKALDQIADGAKHKVVVFELNSYNHDLARGLSNARAISTLEKLGDKVPVVTTATGLEPYGQNDNDWDEGQIFFTPTQVFCQPSYYVAQMISKNYLPLCVKTEVQPATEALDVNAKKSEDGKTLVLQVVNAAEKPLTVHLALNSFMPRKPTARVAEMCGNFSDVNTPSEPEKVKSVEKDWTHDFKDGGIDYTFQPRSFTVLRLE